MTRQLLISIIVLLDLVLTPLASTAQQQEPTIYTYVAHWNVARAQRAEFTANVEKNTRPVMERDVC